MVLHVANSDKQQHLSHTCMMFGKKDSSWPRIKIFTIYSFTFMKLTIKILFAALLFGWATMAQAQVNPHEVKVGNPLRKTILNTIRTPTEAELGQKVEFMVSMMAAKGNWAFVYGMLQQPGGTQVDASKFVDKGYTEAAKEGLFDHNFQALLQKKKGKWVIVERALGCTDLCWAGWWDKKGVPREIFPQ
jgi:hypothetical protein